MPRKKDVRPVASAKPQELSTLFAWASVRAKHAMSDHWEFASSGSWTMCLIGIF